VFKRRLLNKLSNPLSLKSFVYHLPGVLQKWQREQPSTIVYRHTNKYAVAVPAIS